MAPRVARSTELQIELDERVALAATRLAQEPQPMEASLGSVSATRATSATRFRQASETASAATSAQALALRGSAEDPPDVAGPLTTPSETQSKPRVDHGIDLGLSGELFRPRPGDERSLGEARPDATAITRRLNDSLAANDGVERGRARGNVLISALSASVRQAGPAEQGSAIIRVTFNASGELSGVELLKGGVNDWAAAIQSFRARARGKRLQLPRGAAGLRVTYDVRSKLQLPSGAAADSGPIRLERPSLMPNGLTLRGDFDPTDLSGKTSRVVSARVVAEEVL